MNKILVILLFFVAISATAQAPWRAKLYIHFNLGFNQSVTDTVWFGCDSLGNEGYQAGLDQLDTTIDENKVFFEDAIVKNQLGLNTSYNLKISIKAFKKNGEVTFRIQAFGPVESLSWDTNNFIYNQSNYRIYTSRIVCYGCYLNAWEITQFTLLSANLDQSPTFFSKDSIEVLSGSDMSIDFIVRFKDSTTGLFDWNKQENDVFIQNPIIDNKLEVSLLKKDYTRVNVYNQLGQLVWQQGITQSQHIWDVSSLPNGIYLITFNNNTQQTKPIKLVKQ